MKRDERKRLTVRLDHALYKRLKLLCVECAVTVNEFITSTIADALPTEKKKEKV